MNSVAHAMHEFIHGLAPDQCSVEEGAAACGRCTMCEARRQRDVLRRHLEGAFSVSEFLISGSFGRRTAIRPLHDIDLFVVLDPRSEIRTAEQAPSQALSRLQVALGHAYPNKERPKAQSRSVNIHFHGTDLAFDVVPAFPLPSGGYAIPDRTAGKWIGTDPRTHLRAAVAADQRTGSKARPVVKALKSWRAQRGLDQLRSFHLELMVYEALSREPLTYAEGIAQALQHMCGRVLSPFPEPAGLGPCVDAGLSDFDREQVRRHLRQAAQLAELALLSERQGQVRQAHLYWGQLLGSSYSG